MSLTLFCAEVFVKHSWMRRSQKLNATLLMYLMIPEEKMWDIVGYVVVIFQGSENTAHLKIMFELLYELHACMF